MDYKIPEWATQRGQLITTEEPMTERPMMVKSKQMLPCCKSPMGVTRDVGWV